METYEFFQKYANTPLADRLTKLPCHTDLSPDGVSGISLDEIYKRVKGIEDKIRDDVIERNRLINIADYHWQKEELGRP